MESKNSMFKYLVNFDNYISKKDSLLLFLISIFGIIPSVISGSLSTNLWDRILYILESPIANMMFLIEIVIIVFNVRKNICLNELFYSRFTDYKEMLKRGIFTLIAAILLLYLAFVLVAVAGASFMAVGDYGLTIYAEYNISIGWYILFRIIRNMLLFMIIAIFAFLIVNTVKNSYTKLILFLGTLIFFFVPLYKTVNHFYQLPIFFQAYLLNTRYISFSTEIITSIIYIFLLFVITYFLYRLCLRRRGDF